MRTVSVLCARGLVRVQCVRVVRVFWCAFSVHVCVLEMIIMHETMDCVGGFRVYCYENLVDDCSLVAR